MSRLCILFRCCDPLRPEAQLAVIQVSVDCSSPGNSSLIEGVDVIFHIVLIRLPVQSAALKGRLTVVLDLDGTLISSFTPRRAPSLPPGSKSYVVGKGAKLNPNGVLVVERPDLGHFLQKINEFAGMSCIFSCVS